MEFEVERDGGWEETTEDSLGRMSGGEGRLDCAGGNLPGPQRSPRPHAHVPPSRCIVSPPDSSVDNACASPHPELTAVRERDC